MNEPPRAALIRASLMLWSWRTASAFVLVAPVAAWVRDRYGEHPRGDRVLWEPGGYALVDLVQRIVREPGPPLVLFAVGLAAHLLIGLIPLGGALAQVGSPDAVSWGDSLAVGVRRWPALLALFGLFAIAELFVLAGVWLVFPAVGAVVDRRFGAAAGAFAEASFGAVILLLFALPVALVHQTSQLFCIAKGEPWWRSLGLGASCVRMNLRNFSTQWAWRAASGLLAVLLGAALASYVGGKPGASFWVLVAVHQLIAMLREGLRVSSYVPAIRCL